MKARRNRPQDLVGRTATSTDPKSGNIQIDPSFSGLEREAAQVYERRNAQNSAAIMELHEHAWGGDHTAGSFASGMLDLEGQALESEASFLGAESSSAENGQIDGSPARAHYEALFPAVQEGAVAAVSLITDVLDMGIGLYNSSTPDADAQTHVGTGLKAGGKVEKYFLNKKDKKLTRPDRRNRAREQYKKKRKSVSGKKSKKKLMSEIYKNTPSTKKNPISKGFTKAADGLGSVFNKTKKLGSTALEKVGLSKLSKTVAPKVAKSIPVLGWAADAYSTADSAHKTYDAFSNAESGGDYAYATWRALHTVTQAAGFFPGIGDAISLAGDAIDLGVNALRGPEVPKTKSPKGLTQEQIKAIKALDKPDTKAIEAIVTPYQGVPSISPLDTTRQNSPTNPSLGMPYGFKM